MTEQQLEIETKYDVDACAVLPDLAAVPGVGAVDDPETVRLEATYVDTETFVLTRAASTLRYRAGGGEAGWTLKLPEGGDRVELRAAGEPSVVPAELRGVVAGVVRDAPLRPVARIATVRTTVRLRDDARGVLAEVCDDRVEARSLLPDAERQEQHWREWELESVGADAGLREAVGAVLLEAGAAPSRHASKLARTLGDTTPADVRQLRPGSAAEPAGELVRSAVGEQVRQLRRIDPLARADRPDAVHQLRVITRRLRSLLATFAQLFVDGAVAPLREELAWVTITAGRARDAEVMREQLLESIDTSRAAPGTLAGLRDQVDQTLAVRRGRGHTELVEAMNSARYFELLDALARFVDDPPYADAASAAAGDVLPGLVWTDWRRLRRRVRRAERDPEHRAERLHDVRKAAKHARYAADALAPIWGADAAGFAAAMRDVQDALGDHRDAMLAREQLRALGGPERSEEVSFHGPDAETAEHAYADAWKHARRKKLRRWLRPAGSR